jgi:ribosomal protein S18 acetylase RimI-like enzyme
MDGETCFIGKLIVHPDFQNRGIGSKLLTDIEKRLRHARRYELFTGHKSQRNLSFYRKRGYAVFRRQKVSDALTLVFMQKYPGAE